MNEQCSFPSTEGIKYAGSKLKLLPYILTIIAQLPDVASILDGFSGTTRVSQALAQRRYHTTANDIAIWSEVIATCYLKSEKENSYYQEILDYLNALPGYDGWFTEHYGGELEESKCLFQKKNTQKLDAIRDAIEDLHLLWIDKCVILTSLLNALNDVDSALGHYTSYLAQWSPRSFNNLFLVLPKRFPITSHNEVLRNDIFDVVRTHIYDLVYFDPPYGSNNEKMPPSRVRYNAYYHIWKTVILHDKPELFGKAKRRVDSKDTLNPCVFEEYRKDSTGKFIAMNALYELLASTQSRYILLSYSSGGRTEYKDLLDILHANGRVQQCLAIDYKRNIMATMCSTKAWQRESTQHKEFLFLLEK